jgi:hypothetical protein
MPKNMAVYQHPPRLLATWAFYRAARTHANTIDSQLMYREFEWCLRSCSCMRSNNCSFPRDHRLNEQQPLESTIINCLWLRRCMFGFPYLCHLVSDCRDSTTSLPHAMRRMQERAPVSSQTREGIKAVWCFLSRFHDSEKSRGSSN